MSGIDTAEVPQVSVRREHLHRLKHRPKPVPEWVQLARKVAVFGGIGLVLMAVLYWLLSSGWVSQRVARAERAWLASTATAGLGVQDVFVSGRRETASADVLMAVGAVNGAPLLAIDLEAARARLQALPWVKDAVVQRRFPGTLFVLLTERAPIGLWQRDGKHALVDENGTVLASEGLSRWQGLPVLVGEGAPQKVSPLLAELKKYPDVYRRVEALVFVNQRRWTLHLNNGVDVLLPEDDAGNAAALARLNRIQQDGQTLDKDILSLDLRQSDRLIVTPTPEAVTRSKAKKEGI
jgi:cell division protein FtsQ